MSPSGQDEQQANRAAERFYLMGAEIKPESDLFRQRRRRRVFCIYIRGGGREGGRERRRGCWARIPDTSA